MSSGVFGTIIPTLQSIENYVWEHPIVFSLYLLSHGTTSCAHEVTTMLPSVPARFVTLTRCWGNSACNETWLWLVSYLWGFGLWLADPVTLGLWLQSMQGACGRSSCSDHSGQKTEEKGRRGGFIIAPWRAYGCQGNTFLNHTITPPQRHCQTIVNKTSPSSLLILFVCFLFVYLWCVYGCFTCMYICLPQVSLVPVEVRGVHQSPQNWN